LFLTVALLALLLEKVNFLRLPKTPEMKMKAQLVLVDRLFVAGKMVLPRMMS
jgi:hypothetical protein